MRTTWFQILYSVKKQFADINDLNATIEQADKLTATKGNDDADDPRITMLKEYLLDNHQLNDDSISEMLDAMKEEHLRLIAGALKKVYDEVDKVALSNDMKEQYRDVITQIKYSRGTYLNREHRVHQDDIDKISDDELQNIMNAYNTLKNDEKSLQNVIKFIYTGDFQNISYKQITGNDNVPDIPNDILIAPYIIDSLTNVEQFNEDDKLKFYETIISDKFDSDEDMIHKIDAVNADGYVDLSESKQLLSKITSQYQSVSNISYTFVENMIKSTQALRKFAPDLTKLFGNKFTAPSLEVAIEHFISWANDEPVQNCIINNDNYEDAQDYMDDFINVIFEEYNKRLKKITDLIDEHDKLANDEIAISEKRLTLKECIKLWKDFRASGVYKYYGSLIQDAVQEKVTQLLANNSFTLRYKGKDVNVIKSDVNVLDVIQHTDLDSIVNNYDEDVAPFVTTSFQKADLHIGVKLQVENEVLKFLRSFFSIGYKNYKEFDKDVMLHSKAYCFDATCNLIYARDKFIKESVIYEELFYQGDLLVEEENNIDYFNRLADRIKEKNCDLATYVGKYANMADEETGENNNDTADSSTAEKNNLTQDEINNLKQKAEELKKSLTDYGK